MCAKLNQAILKMMPGGGMQRLFLSAYYRFYYNAKHRRESGFDVYYSPAGHYEYVFGDAGIRFLFGEDITDELKRSLSGYIARRGIRSGDTVIDAGAYTGEFTVYAAKAAGPGGKVIAFEPDPSVFSRLLSNIKLNGLSNVLAINKGLWSAKTVLKFNESAQGGNFFKDGATDTIELNVSPLDDELAAHGIKKVDFIKMDVEGAEVEALKGARQTLLDNDVSLAIASYHKLNGEKSSGQVERLLKEFGYGAETSHERHLTTYGWKIKR